MANTQRGQVAFTAGETAYTLSFSINALCNLEDELGEGVNAIAGQMSDPSNVRMKSIRAILWAGLLDNHNVTLAQAGDIMSEAGVPETMRAIGEAFAAAFPAPKTGGKGNGSRPTKAAGAGIGSRSVRRMPAPALTPNGSGE